MVVSRASIQRTNRFLIQSFRATQRTTRTKSWHKVQRRAYAVRGDINIEKSSSDLPWAIGAVVVTVPSVWYLLLPRKKHGHGHDNDHGEHVEHEETPEKKEEDEETSDVEASHEDEKSSESADDSVEEKEVEDHDDGSISKDQEQETPDTSDDDDDESSKNVPHETESGGNVEGVQFKGMTKDGADTRKHIPDAKGYNKKRIESHYGQPQGVLEKEPEAKPETMIEDVEAPSKSPGSWNTMSGKQEGFSNTDTKHSTDIVNNPEKSSTADGQPETAKSKGSVDPRRPVK